MVFNLQCIQKPKMKIPALIILLSIMESCSRSIEHDKDKPELQGTWQVDKIEISKDGQLKKIIKDINTQYWKIFKADSIQIYTVQQIQNSFPIIVTDSIIKAPDDDYLIDKLSSAKMELSNVQNLYEGYYTVVYYLDKVEDH